MKRSLMFLLAAILVMLCSSVFAASDITFQWDRNVDVKTTGYRLYRSTVSGSYQIGPSSPNLAATLPQTPLGQVPTVMDTALPDGTYYWVATAYDAKGNESPKSNEVTVTLDTTPPSSPKNLKQVNIKITVNMKNGQPVLAAIATTGN